MKAPDPGFAPARRLAWLVVILVACGPPADPAGALQRELSGLKQEVRQLAGSGERVRAREVLDRMVALDREHPKVYLAAVDLFIASKRYDEALALMETFGSGGPGIEFGRGLVHIYTGEYAEAEAQLLDALASYERIGHPGGEVASHGALGTVMFLTGKLEPAAARYETSRRLARRLGDTAAEASNLEALAGIELRRERPDEALALQQRWREVCEEADDPVCEARAWRTISGTLDGMRRLEAAVDAAERALALYEPLDQRVQQVVVLQDLAPILVRLGDPQGAAERLERAVALARTIGEANRLAGARSRLGQTYLGMGDARRAIQVLTLAVDAYLDPANDQKAARREGLNSLLELGRALNRVGDHAAATSRLEQALELARSLGKRAIEAEVVSLLAIVHWARGEQARAFVLATESLELYRELGDARGEVEALNNLGTYHWRLGDPVKAGGHYKTCLSLAEGLDDPMLEAVVLANLGVVAEGEGDPGAATEYGKRSLALREEGGDVVAVALTRVSLARALFASGEQAEALRESDRAIDTLRQAGHPDGLSWARIVRADLLRRQGRAEEALGAFDAAIEVAERHGLGRRSWDAYAGRAEVLEALGRFDEALESDRIAMDALEALRGGLDPGDLALRFLAGHYDLYEHALDLQMRLAGTGDAAATAAAFHTAERARGRSLTELLAESRSALRAGLPAEVVEREARLLDRVSSATVRLSSAPAEDLAPARAELQAAEARLKSFQIELRRDAPGYGSVVYPEPVSLARLQEVLGPEELLLNYHVGRDEAYLWVVSSTTSSVRRLAPTERIRDAVDAFLAAGSRPALSLASHRPGVSESERLAEMILPDLPPAARRLLVAASGPLHHVPFDALRRDARYLIEDRELIVVPSATALSVMRRRPVTVRGDGFLGVGAPLGGGTEFPPLPHSAEALTRIASLFPASRRVVLTGEVATKAAVRAELAKGFRHVHFATHGWFDADDPRRSGLKLTPVAEQDPEGFLSLDEVFSLRLDAKLVVLSSCRSGSGELLRGEGLVSLSRAFLSAGAASLIVTLWDVNDASTGEFMSRLYRELQRGGSVAAALRRAKTSFIHSDRAIRRQPYLWAPFVLVGDPDAVREVN